MNGRGVLIAALLLAAGGTPAQQSASYRLKEHTFNAGGHPASGIMLSSASFRVRLDAIGDSIAGTALGSAAFHLDAGFVAAYPPPGEVLNLLFADQQTLVWDAERSVGGYNLYRDLLSALSGLGYGSCEQQQIVGEMTNDPDQPSSGEGYFYLVTAENRIGEEGSKGSDSDGGRRPSPAPCP